MASVSESVSNIRNLATDDLKYVAEEFGKMRISDFLFGISMIFIGISVAGLPMGTIAALLLVAVASQRKTWIENSYSGLFIGLTVLSILYAVIMSLTFGVSPTGVIVRRVARIVIIIFLAVGIADKRIDFRSLILGIATGLLINVAFFYAGLNSHNYGSYLTGWLADKNQSGLWYAVIGLLLIITLKKKMHRYLAIIVFLTLVYLTGSRTSTAAFLFGLLWMFLAKYLNIISKLGLGVFIIWAVDWLTQNLANNEAFGDRTGTDALRSRIDEASWTKINIQPWTGLGYGQATVKVQDNTFFFHNSFWTLIIEGGWIYAISIVAITLYFVFFAKQPQEKSAKYSANSLTSESDHQQRQVLGEAGMILLFICSWRLGEVLLTVPWALVLGVSMSYLATPKNTIAQ